MRRFNNRWHLALFLLAVGVLPVTLSFATTWVAQPVSVYYENAEIVARVQIVGADSVIRYQDEMEIWCRTNARAKVIEVLKGEAETVQFQIEGMTVNLREEYLVFLERPDANDVSPMKSTNSVSQELESIRGRACKGTVEGLQANWLSTSRFIPTWSDAEQEFELWITPGYNVAIPEHSGVVYREVELLSLLVDGEEVERIHWGPPREIPYPNDFWTYNGAFSWESYRKHILESISE